MRRSYSSGCVTVLCMGGSGQVKRLRDDQKLELDYVSNIMGFFGEENVKDDYWIILQTMD